MLIFSQRHALQGGRRSINARSIGARIAEKKVREGKDYPESPGRGGGDSAFESGGDARRLA